MPADPLEVPSVESYSPYPDPNGKGNEQTKGNGNGWGLESVTRSDKGIGASASSNEHRLAQPAARADWADGVRRAVPNTAESLRVQDDVTSTGAAIIIHTVHHTLPPTKSPRVG